MTVRDEQGQAVVQAPASSKKKSAKSAPSAATVSAQRWLAASVEDAFMRDSHADDDEDAEEGNGDAAAPTVQKLEIVPKKPSGRFSLPSRLSRFSLGNNKSASDGSSDGLAREISSITDRSTSRDSRSDSRGAPDAAPPVPPRRKSSKLEKADLLARAHSMSAGDASQPAVTPSRPERGYFSNKAGRSRKSVVNWI